MLMNKKEGDLASRRNLKIPFFSFLRKMKSSKVFLPEKLEELITFS